MATVRDVAKLSGVSPATVTHVLRNRQNISPQTRQRVLQAVRALDYRPGTIPNGERGTQTIGVFVWLEAGYPLRDNPYATQVLDGVLSVTLSGHWNIMLFNVTAWDDAPTQVRQLADGRCDGFILVAPPPDVGIPEALRERGYPFVLVNSGSTDSAVNSVDIDNRAAGAEIAAHLIESGHRRIAVLPGADSYDNTGERLQGLFETCRAAGLPDPARWILRPGTYDYGQSQERVIAMVTRLRQLPERERPTALICGNDKLARAAIEIFAAEGIAVPEHISITGFDDIEYATDHDLKLTTVRQSLHELGVRAAEILLGRIAAEQVTGAPAPPVVKEFLPHALIRRDSVRRIA